MPQSSDNRELPILLSALCNETITGDQHARLDELLQNDNNARQMYYESIELHIKLSHWASTKNETDHLIGLQKQLDSILGREGESRLRSWAWSLVAVAAILLISFLVQNLFLHSGSDAERLASTEKPEGGIAVPSQGSQGAFQHILRPLREVRIACGMISTNRNLMGNAYYLASYDS